MKATHPPPPAPQTLPANAPFFLRGTHQPIHMGGTDIRSQLFSSFPFPGKNESQTFKMSPAQCSLHFYCTIPDRFQVTDHCSIAIHDLFHHLPIIDPRISGLACITQDKMSGQFSRAYGILLRLGSSDSGQDFSYSSIHRRIIILASCGNLNDLGLDIFGDFYHLGPAVTPTC